jgi:riboflavin kinase/FMN adenylyltransferase
MLVNILKDDLRVFKTTNKVATIGAFDGMHLAHQMILQKTIEVSKEKNLDPLLLTFYPLPKVFFDKSKQVKEILDLQSKQEIVLKLGIKNFIALEFDTYLANMEAVKFLNQILIDSLNIKVLVVGYDFRFGKNRQFGVLEISKELAKRKDFELIVIPKLEIDEKFPKSTQIRSFIQKEDYNKATELLGWDYEIFKSNKEIIFNKTSLVAKQS